MRLKDKERPGWRAARRVRQAADCGGAARPIFRRSHPARRRHSRSSRRRKAGEPR